MSDPSQRGWRFYLDDMIDFAGKVLAYTDGLDQAGFVASRLTYDASLRNLELIGEAATHIPDEVRAARTEIPWRMIIATCNRVIHGYLGIDDQCRLFKQLLLGPMEIATARHRRPVPRRPGQTRNRLRMLMRL